MSARFITFYSYKGGVGRTMTLANVAAWLATDAHKRVFLLDFDLEAPGLSYYASQTPLVAGLPGPGLVEFFTEYRTTARLPDLRKYVIEEPEDRLGGGRLMMIGAGKHGTAEYAESLAALDWKALYESGFGFELVEHLRAAIVEQFHPDIVLVDSRTGLHGIGSIATQQLADLVVVMFGLNLQNIEGARGIVANIEENPYRSETGRDIETLLVASPVYDEGSEVARGALRRAEKLLGRRIDARIPFSAAAVYDERLWPLDPDDAPRALLQVYGELGARLLRPPPAPSTSAEGQTFEALIAQLFEIEGYTVSPSEASEFELLAERDAFPSREKMAVQIAPGGPPAAAVRRMRALLEGLDHAPWLGKAVICTEGRPADDLWRAAEKDRRLAVVSLGELMQRLIPFKRYLESLAQAFERDDLSRYYEPLDVAPLDRPEEKTGADPTIDAWLDDASSPHLALLGDYGTGKTSFCRRLAAKLARARLAEDEWTGRVPVLVSLRNYAKALNVESVVNNLLSDRQRFASGSFAAFDLLNREGKLVILLDGFDEMATRVDERVVLENFRELRRLVHPRSKVLLTCRTHYFQTRGQADSVLAGGLVEEARSESGFRTIELAPLGREQIESIVRRRADDPEKALELIRKTYDLERLSERPVLLDMILTTIPELGKVEGKLNAARLYGVYTAQWISTDAWRSRLTPAQKECLMEALAVWMYAEDKTSVHYSDLRVFTRDELGEKVATLQDLDHFDYDVRTCSFVNRDDGGNYRFMHKSFQEYFLARHFARELTGGDDPKVFGLRTMPREVGLFLADMEEVTDERLLVQTVLKDSNEERFGGGNAATVLALRGRLREASGGDLSRRNLRGADFSDQNLSGFRFEEAVLDRARFLNTRLSATVFRGASLASALLDGGGFRRVSIGGGGAFVAGLGAQGVTVWNTADASLSVHITHPVHGRIMDAEAHATDGLLVMLIATGHHATVETHDLRAGTTLATVTVDRQFQSLTLHQTRREAVLTGGVVAKLLIGVEGAVPAELDSTRTDGARVAAGARAVVTELGIAWMMSSGKIAWFREGGAVGIHIDARRIAYAHSPITTMDNRYVYLVLRSGSNVYRWSAISGGKLEAIKLEESGVDPEPYWLYRGPREDTLVCGGISDLCVIRIDGLRARIIVRKKQHIQWLAVSADGKLAAVADGSEIRLLTVPNLHLNRTLHLRLVVEGADFQRVSGLDRTTLETLRKSGAVVDPDAPAGAAADAPTTAQPKPKPRRVKAASKRR